MRDHYYRRLAVFSVFLSALALTLYGGLVVWARRSYEAESQRVLMVREGEWVQVLPPPGAPAMLRCWVWVTPTRGINEVPVCILQTEGD